ncbi:MAG TPA: apolipoprotein N-acyltransferase [Burkholderiales bacterium]|nr:apolipoprotein N-acyltransferase [Burkholderiales bacterium]
MPRDTGTAEHGEPRARSRRLVERLALDRLTIGAFLLGPLSVLGFAPLYLYPLPILALAALFLLWLGASTPRRAAAIGWWFGVGFFLAGVSWVYVSLNTFGAMPAPLAAFFTLLFCAFLALFPAAAGYCVAAIRVNPWLAFALVAPSAWMLTEWVRGWIFTGFPWLAVGYSQIPGSALAGYAPVTGIFGVSLATLMSAGLLALLADALMRSRRAHAKPSASALAAPIVALAVVWGAGYGLSQTTWTAPAGEPVEVTLLQGNIPQEIKWTMEGLRKTLITYRDLAYESKAKLIVFPETAIPMFLRDIPADYLSDIADHARHNGGDALIGVPEQLPSGDYYNSVISIGTSKIQAYRKSHLVPFGEFIPLRPVLGWIVGVLAIPLQDFSRGGVDQQPLAVAGQRVALNICYEDAFGEEIIRQLPQATMLVNVSNVAWFGRSIAPYQHLQISQARAIETGRYMMRATNTGMTAVIDTRGKVVDAAPEFTTAAVTARVQGYSGATPYVRAGNRPVLLLALLLLAGAWLYSRRPAQSR